MAAAIYDIQSLIQAGIDPKTGLPIKLGLNEASELKNNIKKVLRIVDRQDAVRRYKWYNLPDGLDGELLERVLYYKGQGMFFFMKENTTFYFLPYALDGNIDVYGRYTGVTPLPFNGVASLGKGEKQKPWITGLNRKPVYSIKLDEVTLKDFEESCVLLHDYCKDMSQTTLPRQGLNEPILDTMAECIPYMRTNLMLGTGIMGVRVNDADQERSVQIANGQFKDAALQGKGYIPVVGNIEMQELSGGNLAGSEEYMLAMQSIDNFRLSLYGLENGGLFEKKAHELQVEADVNSGNVGLVYQDGLTIRQKFCDIVNSIWGLGIWCEPSESVLGQDANGDGMDYDNQATASDDGGSIDDQTDVRD